MKLNKIFIIWASLYLVAGCAPNLRPRTYNNTQVNFDPSTNDSEIDFDKLTNQKRHSLRYFEFHDEVETSDFLELTNHLFNIGKLAQMPIYTESAKGMLQEFYSYNDMVTSLSLKESPYLSAVFGEAKPLLVEEIDGSVVKAEVSRKKLIDFIRKSHVVFSSSIEAFDGQLSFISLEPILNKVENYLKVLIVDIDNEKEIDPKVVKTFKKELTTAIEKELPVLKERIKYIEEASDLTTILKNVTLILDQLKIKLDEKSNSEIQTANKINDLIVNGKSEQDVLTLLVTLWYKFDKQEKKQYIKSASKDLYRLFRIASQHDLNCMAKSKCYNPFIYLFKSKVIFPKIEKIGVQNILQEIKIKYAAAAKAQLHKTAEEYIKQLPDLLVLNINSSFEIKISQALLLKTNFDSIFKNAFSSFTQRRLKNKINFRLFEPDRISISFSSQKIKISPPRIKTQGVDSKMIGLSMSSQVNFWNSLNLNKFSEKELLTQQLFENFNRLLVMGSYTGTNGQLSNSLTMPIYKNLDEKFDIRKITSLKYPYAIFDRFLFDSEKQNITKVVRPNVSVESQAELLYGLSKVIEFHHDWKSNNYDNSIAEDKLTDLVNDIDQEEFRETIFPKFAPMSLAIGNAAVILTNLCKENSPLFFIKNDGSKEWSDCSISDYVKAGIVDIKNGKRANFVSSFSLAKYIIGLSEFIKSIKEIEKTKSPVLTKVNIETGKTLAKELSEKKDSLVRVLFMLANYLTKDLMGKDNGIYSKISIDSGNIIFDGPRTLNDQINSIRALLLVSELAQDLDDKVEEQRLKAYRSAAIEIYYFMNKKMFSYKLGFYSLAEGFDFEPSPLQIVNTIRTLLELKPFLPESSAKQLDKILSYWL